MFGKLGEIAKRKRFDSKRFAGPRYILGVGPGPFTIYMYVRFWFGLPSVFPNLKLLGLGPRNLQDYGSGLGQITGLRLQYAYGPTATTLLRTWDGLQDLRLRA